MREPALVFFPRFGSAIMRIVSVCVELPNPQAFGPISGINFPDQRRRKTSDAGDLISWRRMPEECDPTGRFCIRISGPNDTRLRPDHRNREIFYESWNFAEAGVSPAVSAIPRSGFEERCWRILKIHST